MRTLRVAAVALAAAFGPLAHAAGTTANPGDKTVASICSMCHGSGLMGAPKIGDGAAWGARLKAAGSIDVLVESAEHGKNSMPPRGGHPELSDADLKAAIESMLSQSGVGTAPPHP